MTLALFINVLIIIVIIIRLTVNLVLFITASMDGYYAEENRTVMILVFLYAVCLNVGGVLRSVRCGN